MVILTCSCCGGFIEDSGYGMCRRCGGDDRVEIPPGAAPDHEEKAKKRFGWAKATFCEARFALIRHQLSSENQAKWDGLSYAEKCRMVERLIERGALV
jgi:hypothetical protein